jgi:hypothetical protein
VDREDVVFEPVVECDGTITEVVEDAPVSEVVRVVLLFDGGF